MAPGTPRIRLWYSPGSCSFVPNLLLNEAGLDFEPILAQVKQFSEEFIKLNPKRRVPVLALDDEVITETPAILTAIAQLVPEQKFLGSTPLETVRVYEWLIWLSGTVHTEGFAARWRPERFTNDAAATEALKAGALQNVKNCYAEIEHKLAGSGTTYAVGNSYTAVDPYLLVIYRWGSRLEGIDMARDHPHYTAHANKLLRREATTKALALHTSV